MNTRPHNPAGERPARGHHLSRYNPTVVVDSTWLVLLDGYSKSDQENLTADELAALRRAADEIEADIRSESGSQGSSEAE